MQRHGSCRKISSAVIGLEFMTRTHIIIYTAMFLALFSAASCRHDEKTMPDPLDEVGQYVFEYPDSALNVLDSLPPSLLDSGEKKAKYALMYSIASDITGERPMQDSLVSIAYNYYKKYGSGRDRLEAYYFMGRIYGNAGNENMAMSCFVRAEYYMDGSESPEFAGRLYYAKARLYEDGFGYRDAIKNYDLAAQSYLRAGDAEHYAESCVRAARSCFSMGDKEKARDFLSRIDTYWDDIRDSDKVRYFRLLVRMDEDISLDDVLKAVDEQIEDTGTLEAGNLLSIADIYLQSGYVDSAMTWLNRYSVMNSDFRRNPTFWLRLSSVYDSLGQAENALSAYRRHVVLKDSTYMDKLQENVRLVEKRFDEQVNIYRVRMVWTWVFVALAVTAAVAIFLIFRFRRKFWRQSRRAEHLEGLYRSVSDEKEALSGMVKNSVLIDEPTRKVLENRLSVLDELLTVRLLDKDRYSPEKASEMIESIALDKDAYLNSLGLMFSVRHPAVADRFRSLQLSTWEIGYCSLYCMGYKGKDIGNILSSSRYYKINSVIRKKFGIGPKDTNIDIYLRKLMSDIESEDSERRD